jgi:hypothetical protein
MVTRKVVVTPEKAHPGLLPPWASQYVVGTQWLAQQGILEKMGQQLQIVRQGGYTGADGFNFFLPITSANCDAGCRSSVS